jgi:MGT family glycosyltransferase
LSNILLTVTPTPGHVNPFLAIARHLRGRGHSVLFNTADPFRAQVESSGLRFIPLIGRANFDYRTFNKFLPEGQTLTPGPEEMRHNAKHIFADTMLPQYDGIRDIMSRESIDLILTDFLFTGVFPLLLGPRAGRPPIVSVSVSPLVLTSTDASPFGPAVTIEEKELNRLETARFQASLGDVNDYMNDILAGRGCPPLPGFFLDCIYTLPDMLLQLSVDALEFPRRDLPGHIKFVGPVLPALSKSFQTPEWFKELDGSKPVVLVTQGTVANTDLSNLIGPTIAVLSTEDVITIAATGNENAVLNTPIPSNVRVTPFVPFVELFPRVDVFVTNGGYGAVNQALSLGVPIVVAGDTEDKAFVAARVAWVGAGINLGTSRPTYEQLRAAMKQVLHDGKYRANAKRLQREFAKYNALDSISGYIESFLVEGTPETSNRVPFFAEELTTRPRFTSIGAKA